MSKNTGGCLVMAKEHWDDCDCEECYTAYADNTVYWEKKRKAEAEEHKAQADKARLKKAQHTPLAVFLHFMNRYSGPSSYFVHCLEMFYEERGFLSLKQKAALLNVMDQYYGR